MYWLKIIIVSCSIWSHQRSSSDPFRPRLFCPFCWVLDDGHYFGWCCFLSSSNVLLVYLHGSIRLRFLIWPSDVLVLLFGKGFDTDTHYFLIYLHDVYSCKVAVITLMTFLRLFVLYLFCPLKLMVVSPSLFRVVQRTRMPLEFYDWVPIDQLSYRYKISAIKSYYYANIYKSIDNTYPPKDYNRCIRRINLLN